MPPASSSVLTERLAREVLRKLRLVRARIAAADSGHQNAHCPQHTPQ
jgi:hypothetical protein